VAKKSTKLFRKILLPFDYAFSVFFFLLCLVGLPFAIPWIRKQRRIWNDSGKGNQKVLILRGLNMAKLMKQGYELLLPYLNPNLKWISILDATNTRKTENKITDNLYLITWESPRIVRLMERMKFKATSIVFRELVAIFQITSYCVKERIGVLRPYKHDYPALQALLVSCFIKIPFIVDIIGNFELAHRLTGKVFYFRELNKLSFLRIFAHRANNWLLGLPLRHAFRVLGRNKCCYEHAFALGAPVDRLSLLRLSNFSAEFNSYNPAKPPAKQIEYPYLLFVGRLVDIKYPLDVLAAFDLAASHLPEHRLVIIGDGALRDDVEQKKERSEYKDRIVLMGACSSNTVLDWTAHATVSICPISGATLVEALLCGIPVIAYDVAWHAEMLIDDYSGFLVPFRNIAALAEKMIEVVRNHEEAKIVAMRGRELARVAFDKEKIVEKESMYYMQALTDSQN
jgi:glycosyltransferase involved in cell wall biosynthesis